MTQTIEPAKEKQTGIPAVAGSPKPKPAVASRPSGSLPCGVARLAPFDTYKRIDTAKGSGPKEDLVEVGGMRSKPVAKKRLISIFSAGATRR